jgi:hypothetical protein
LQLRADKPVRIMPENPNRLGVYVLNAGGILEVPVPLPALSTVFLDSATVQVPAHINGTYKSFYLVVDTAFAWAGAFQPTVKLIVSREPYPAAGGAGSAIVTGEQLKGASANLGPAAATSLALGIWTITPADLADLQWEHLCVGLEFQFGGALSAGAARLFLEMPGSPVALLGESQNIRAQAFEAATAWPIPYGPGQFIQHDGELWGLATSSALDLRIWELLRLDSSLDP